jgi:hypothetical protein
VRAASLAPHALRTAASFRRVHELHELHAALDAELRVDPVRVVLDGL